MSVEYRKGCRRRGLGEYERGSPLSLGGGGGGGWGTRIFLRNQDCSATF